MPVHSNKSNARTPRDIDEGVVDQIPMEERIDLSESEHGTLD